jgi:hypothetical protein
MADACSIAGELDLVQKLDAPQGHQPPKQLYPLPKCLYIAKFMIVRLVINRSRS